MITRPTTTPGRGAESAAGRTRPPQGLGDGGGGEGAPARASRGSVGSPFGRQGPAGILLGDGGPCTAAARRWGSPYPNRGTDAADSPYLRIVRTRVRVPGE